MILINYWTNNVLITNHYFEKNENKKNIQKYFFKEIYFWTLSKNYQMGGKSNSKYDWTSTFIV